MKLFLRIFCCAFAVFTVIFFILGGYFYNIYDAIKVEVEVAMPDEFEFISDDGNQNTERLNILFLGVAEYSLSDTIILASYCPVKKQVDLISIPRDTYFHREGYNSAQQKKINAAHTVRENKGQSSMDAVSKLMNMPVHGYVKLDYTAVEKIVDVVGPIEVAVTERMYYRDPKDTPPLLIDFKPGIHRLNGKKAVEYLRYRDPLLADIGRIQRQQDFVLKVIKNSMSLTKIPKIAEVAKEYTETSIEISEMLKLTPIFLSMNEEDFITHTIGGEGKTINGVSYYIPDYEEIRKLVRQLYE